MTSEPVIAIRDLRLSYGRTCALNSLDLDLPTGQIVGLLSENGCGKTTLLKVLAGVLSEYEGEVRIAGHEPGPQSKAVVSFLPDVRFLPPTARVSHGLKLYADFFPDFNAAKAAELIGFFGLSDSMRLKEMSKGIREKVQIALAMSRDARVFLLDEPISGVGPAARQVLLDGILRTLSEDSLLFISTHLVHDLESIVDSAVMMRHGQVLLSGQLDDLRTEHGLSHDQLFRKVSQ